MSLFQPNLVYQIIENTITQDGIKYVDHLDNNAVDKIINISSIGVSLIQNLRTTKFETIITPLRITHVDESTSTTRYIDFDKLTLLPISLAALVPPFSNTTLHIKDTLLVDNLPNNNSTKVMFDSIVLSDGTITNTIDKNGYTANVFNINITPTMANTASRFGQVGLVKLKTLVTNITGSINSFDFDLTDIFTTAYKNYRIILEPSIPVSFTAYPAYNLKGFLGTGTGSETVNLYGYDITSSLLTPLFNQAINISTSPVKFSVEGLTNKQIIFDITNVGFLNTVSNSVNIYCKSFYNTASIKGTSDRNIDFSSGINSTITGLKLQQTSIGSSNNMGLQAIIYGYNKL